MSLNKAIAHGKEKRKPYRKAKAIDRSCRNNGSCPYCAKNRQYTFKKASRLAQYDIKHYFDDSYERAI